MMIYTVPFISAIIGWFTNYIAVKMLFHPRKPTYIFGFNIQGVFPKRQSIIATKIGKMVADELLRIEDIQQKLHSPEAINSIHTKLQEKIDYYLNVSMPHKYPVMSLFIGVGVKSKIKNEVLEQVENIAPEMLGSMVQSIEDNLNIEELISSKVNSFAPEKLEKILNDILKNEFTFIEWVGAILGFVIGVIQLIIVILFPNT